MSFKEYVGKWFNLFNEDILLETLNKLGDLYKKEIILPEQNKVFRAFHECNYDDCKVVMIGQSPYADKYSANGILFSNDLHNKTLSPSLKVIMEASGSNDQTLLSWCQQGVLMLNAALSVKEGQPSSHFLLWRPFISNFLKNLSEWNSGLVYILFGNDAQSLKPYINNKFNDILEEKHPAYYARLNQEMPSRVFNETDKLLFNKYKQTIKW